MSTTIAQRQGVRVRPAPIVALLVAVIVAAAVLLLVDHPSSSTTKAGALVAVRLATGSFIAPVSARQAILRRHIREARAKVDLPVATPAAWKALHNHRWSTTLDALRVRTTRMGV